ncbi:MAG: acyl-CoA thioesterase [Sandaracinaceae bacterium]|nr:acyl-CoA thioesterase [Sandaracinaceae bacterium]
MSPGEKKTTRYRVRVGYVDTDQAGVVHHSTYLRYLEAARVEYLRTHGIDYKKFEIEGRSALPVVEVAMRYKLPARFDEELEIETWVGVVTRARLRFDCRVWRGTELLTESEITLACVRMPEGALQSMPPEILRACGE